MGPIHLLEISNDIAVGEGFSALPNSSPDIIIVYNPNLTFGPINRRGFHHPNEQRLAESHASSVVIGSPQPVGEGGHERR